MRRQGLFSGSEQAKEHGITTQTEKILGSGAQTNPMIRMSVKEEEYVLSQLIQKNFEKRRGLSVFNSKTARLQALGHKQFGPPIGLYEHKFNQSAVVETPPVYDYASGNSRSTSKKRNRVNESAEADADAEIDMKKIVRPYMLPANKQQFSCFAETPKVDFSKRTYRDDVSYYKKLARFERSQRLGIALEHYEKLVRQHKTGKVVVKFDEDIAMQQKRQQSKNQKNMRKTTSASNVSCTSPSVNEVASGMASHQNTNTAMTGHN